MRLFPKVTVKDVPVAPKPKTTVTDMEIGDSFFVSRLAFARGPFGGLWVCRYAAIHDDVPMEPKLTLTCTEDGFVGEGAFRVEPEPMFWLWPFAYRPMRGWIGEDRL